MHTWPIKLMSVGMALTFCGMLALFYLYFLQNPSPLVRQRFVGIEATTTNGHSTFIIAREFCAANAGDGTIIRIFRRVPVEPGDLEEVYELVPLPIHLLPGCHVRPRAVELPDTIQPGKYIYQSGLRWCAVRCKTDWMPPVRVEIDNFGGRHQLRIDRIGEVNTPSPEGDGFRSKAMR